MGCTHRRLLGNRKQGNGARPSEPGRKCLSRIAAAGWVNHCKISALGSPIEAIDCQAPLKQKPKTPIAPTNQRKNVRSGEVGLSDSAMRSKARKLGWSKSCGEPVETFMGRSGWRKEGTANSARWFKN